MKRLCLVLSVVVACVAIGILITPSLHSQNGGPVVLFTTAGAPTGVAATPLQVSVANTGANGTAILVNGTGGTFPVTGTFWQATQPVSGTVTANAGTGDFAVNIAQINGGTVATAGQTGTQSVGGSVATNTNVSSANYPLLIAGSDYGGTPKLQNAKVDSSGFLHVSLEASTGTSTVTGAGGTFPVTGTFWQATQPISIASAQVASGAYASGSIADGAMVTLGSKADAKSAATDTTSITSQQVFKEISAMVQLLAQDPCTTNLVTPVTINQTTTTQVLDVAGSSNYYVICSLHLITATAQNVALIDSATHNNACATSPTGLTGFGGSTAATGWNFAANGGIVLPAAKQQYGATSATNHAMCVAQSGSGQVSGGFTYVTSTTQ